jgi:glutamyl-tRNA synthetase
MPDFVRDARPFLTDDFEYQEDAVAKHLLAPGKGGAAASVERLRALREALAGVEPFDEAGAEAALRALAERRGETAAQHIHPLRVALLGTAVSPGVFAVLALIGRERALRRLERLAEFLASRHGS